jgi:hypothetical protein
MSELLDCNNDPPKSNVNNWAPFLSLFYFSAVGSFLSHSGQNPFSLDRGYAHSASVHTHKSNAPAMLSNPGRPVHPRNLDMLAPAMLEAELRPAT